MNVNVNVTWKALEVRAEGSRRGFSKLGNDMKRTRPHSYLFTKHEECSRAQQSRARRPWPPAARNHISRFSAR